MTPAATTSMLASFFRSLLDSKNAASVCSQKPLPTCHIKQEVAEALDATLVQQLSVKQEHSGCSKEMRVAAGRAQNSTTVKLEPFTDDLLQLDFCAAEDIKQNGKD